MLQSLAKNLMFSPGIELGTFRVLGGCDNHYTTETEVEMLPAQTVRHRRKIAPRKWNSLLHLGNSENPLSHIVSL